MSESIPRRDESRSLELVAPRIQAVPTLLLMAGLPGSGKSTLALALGHRLGWLVLDKDTVKSALLELAAPEVLAGEASYVVLYDLARDFVVKQGLSVILDTPAFYPRVLEVARDITRDAHAQLRVVLCLASQEVRIRRLTDRSRVASQPGAGDLRSYSDDRGNGRKWFDHLPQDTLIVDTNGPITDIVEQAVAYTSGGRKPA